MLDPIELLRKLVSIPSVNPSLPGNAGPGAEGKLAQWLAEYLSARGFEVEMPEVLPGRPNLVASRPGTTKQFIGFCAHLDTMPVGGMTVPAFDALVRNGHVWGRGSADTKASIAAMLFAVLTETQASPEGCPSILLLFTCDEEAGFRGAQHFAASSRPPISGMVIGEPTGLKLVTAHKGVYRTIIRTTGRAAHASVPHEGVNAIYRMAAVVQRLEALAGELARERGHELLGHPTLNVGVIAGGTAVNTVPDQCTIDVDRRVLPGETTQSVTEELRSALAGIQGTAVEEPFVSVPSFAIEAEHPWRAAMAKALRQRPDGVAPYATDAPVLHYAGIPCVVYGPGAMSAAHTADEHVAIDDVLAGVRGYRSILRHAGAAQASR